MKNVLNRIFKIISSAIFVILIILIIIILAYVIRIKYLSSQGRLGDVRLNFYTILTQSMVPTIYAGDVVVTYKNTDNKYQTGDILTFTSDINGGINITHRIQETYKVNNKYSYKTKGDNNSVADSEIVKGERVLGKVVLKIPKIGFLQQFLTEKHRWIILIVLPCLGIIIYDILKLAKSFRKEKEYPFKELAKDKAEALDFGPPPKNNTDFDSNASSDNQIDENNNSIKQEVSTILEENQTIDNSLPAKELNQETKEDNSFVPQELEKAEEFKPSAKEDIATNQAQDINKTQNLENNESDEDIEIL